MSFCKCHREERGTRRHTNLGKAHVSGLCELNRSGLTVIDAVVGEIVTLLCKKRRK